MSLQDCLKKAGKAFNATDADVINEKVEQLVAEGVDRNTAEMQAVSEFVDQSTAELEDIVSRAEAAGATVARLDPSEAARLQRAEDMGFDTSRVLYHWTDNTFDSFKPSSSGKLGEGVYFSPIEEYGQRYTSSENPTVHAAFVRGKIAKSDDIDSAFNQSREELKATNSLTTKAWKDRGNEILKERGFAGKEVSDEVVIFDPKNIRSVNATFDPAESDSSQLLAQGVEQTGLLNISPDQTKEIMSSPYLSGTGLKVRKNGRFYRGVGEGSGSGMAVYGTGLYVAGSKKEAGKYGRVIELDKWDLPQNPLRFSTINDYEIWLQQAQKTLGYKGPREFNADVHDIRLFIKSLGDEIDGIQISTGPDAIFVNYAGRKVFQQRVEQTETAEFKEWFGESKVVDDNGDPLVVHHGGLGASDIQIFDTAYGGQTTGNNEHGAFHFTDVFDVAEDYGRQSFIRRYQDNPESLVDDNLATEEEVEAHVEQGDVYEWVDELAEQNLGTTSTYLKIENPFMLDMEGERVDVEQIERVSQSILAIKNQDFSEVSEDVMESLLELGKFDQSDIDDYRTEIEERAREEYGLEDSEEIEEYQFEDATRGVLEENGIEEVYPEFDGIIIRNMIDDIGDASNQVADQFIAFESEQVKSVDNQGTFDPNDPNIYNQASRGYYDPQNVLIRLNEASNPSTFMHEFAHFMYDMEGKLGGKNIEAVNEWFKTNAESLAIEANEYAPNTTILSSHVQDYIDNGTAGDTERDDAILRATHEQFARGFETYIMEGKSPSMELRNFFRIMARMLNAVYRMLKGGLNSPNVTDDMRQVFDRLLATEEQIEAYSARDRAAPMFTDAVMAGMTEKQFEKYQERAQKAEDKANETLRDKVMAELTRVHEQWWKEERKDIVDDISESLQDEAVYVARNTLRNGDMKLDYIATIDILGVENLMGVHQLRSMTAKGGLGAHPDEVAKVYGFDTGSELIDALMTEPKLQDKAAEMADAEMINRHGDILNDGTIERLAEDAVRNEERGSLLLTEIKALAKGQNIPAIDKQLLKSLAEQRIGEMALKDIRPDRYRKAEIRSASEAATALANDDKEDALRAKTQQAMNFYLWRAATDAKLQGGKIATYMARFNKKSVRERIGKAGNGYLDNIDRILERFEFRKSKSLRQHEEERDSLQTWVDKQGAESDMIALSPAVLNESYVAHWREVPMDALTGIHESIQSIENSARSLNEILIGEEKLNFEQAVKRMLDKMSELPDKHFGQFRDSVDKGGVRRWTENFLTEQVKIPWMLRWLDNREEVGVMHQTLMQPMNDAYDAEVHMWNKVGKVVMEAIQNRSKEDVKRHKREISIPEIANDETGLDGVLEGHQILAVALNTGNEGNLRKMLLGEGWAISDEDVSIENPKLQAILQHMSESDWDLVELIWQQIGTLKDDLSAVHKRATGVAMQEVQPTPFVLANGREITGGYYPVVYDANRSEQARLNEEKAEEQAVSMLTAGGFVQPVARTGARINRTEFTGPIRYSLDVVPNHIQEVVHFITHYEAIKQVNKLTSDPRIADAVKKKLGANHYALFKPWLNDIAKDGKETPIKSGIESLARRLRFGTTYGVMGFKASTGLIQLAGLSNTMAEVGAKRVYRAIRTILGSEKSIRETWEFAKANSKILEHRQQTMDREIKNAMVNVQNKRGILAPVQEASMKHIALIQTYTVDLPSWYAAYDKGMEKFEGDEKRAFQYADWVIENVQGSGLTKDMSGIMRSKTELYRLATMFMTFFSSLYNHNADVKKAVQAGQISPASAVAKIMMLWTLPALFETIMREGFGDEDDEENLLERTLVGTASMPLASVPFFNQVANGVISGFGYSASPVLPIVEGGVEAITQLSEGGELTEYKLKQSSKALGIAFGVPGVNQAWITGEHAYDVIVEGEDLSMRYLLVTTDKDK